MLYNFLENHKGTFFIYCSDEVEDTELLNVIFNRFNISKIMD